MNRTTQPVSTDDCNILTFDSDSEFDPESTLDDPIFTPSTDEFDEQVAEAQAQLEQLRAQQEEIERQKAELEQLRIKQSEFQRGRVEMIENLQHALDVLERDTFDAEQRVEQCHRARECFGRHLDTIANLRPESWSREELRSELDGACHIVTEAREDYTRTLTHLDTLSPEHGEFTPFAPVAPPAANAEPSIATAAPTEKDFAYWLRSGFAFTLPMMTFGVFALMLMLLFG